MAKCPECKGVGSVQLFITSKRCKVCRGTGNEGDIGLRGSGLPDQIRELVPAAEIEKRESFSKPSSSKTQFVLQEDLSGRSVRMSDGAFAPHRDFDGVRRFVQVRNFPIAQRFGGLIAINAVDVEVTINGVPEVVLTVDGAEGLLELSTAPKAGDEVRVSYFFNHPRNLMDDTVAVGTDANCENVSTGKNAGKTFEIITEASWVPADKDHPAWTIIGKNDMATPADPDPDPDAGTGGNITITSGCVTPISYISGGQGSSGNIETELLQKVEDLTKTVEALVNQQQGWSSNFEIDRAPFAEKIAWLKEGGFKASAQEQGDTSFLERQIPALAPIATCIWADAFAKIEAEGGDTEFVLMHPCEFADLRKFSETSGLTIGKKSARLWGVPIFSDHEASRGNAFAYGTLPDGKLMAVLVRVTR